MQSHITYTVIYAVVIRKKHTESVFKIYSVRHKVRHKQEAAFNHSKVWPHLWFYKAISSTVFLHKLPVPYHCIWRSMRGGNFNEK